MLYTHSFSQNKSLCSSPTQSEPLSNVQLQKYNRLYLHSFRTPQKLSITEVSGISTIHSDPLGPPLSQNALQKSLVFLAHIQNPSVITQYRIPWYFLHSIRAPQSLPITEVPGISPVDDLSQPFPQVLMRFSVGQIVDQNYP